MPDFEFQPWERLSKSVTDGEAHAHVDINEKRWLFRQCGPFWFCRDAQKSGAEYNFVLRGLAMVSNTFGQVSWEEPQLTNLEWYVGTGLHSDSLMRVWKLADSLVCWIYGGWWQVFDPCQSCSNAEDGVEFCPSNSVPGEVQPSSVLFALLQEEWVNPDSDLRASARMLAVPPSERPLWCVTTRLDSPQKLVHTLGCALRAFGAIWTGEIAAMTLTLSADSGGRFALTNESAFDSSAGGFVLNKENLLGIREHAILNHIVRAFEPRQLPHDPAISLTEHLLRGGGWTNSFEVTQMHPSAHDKLESLLELRAWLGEHWPDGVRHLEKVL